MLEHINLRHILFLDIETVPQYQNFSQLDIEEQELFASKTAYQRLNTDYSIDEFYGKAGIWAEFGKIICISVGVINAKNNILTLNLKSFSGDEPDILNNFAKLLNTHFNNPKYLLCAHNGKEFDFPYIARRMVICGIELPSILNLFGKKPWEVQHLDTLELWKFGDYKHYTSLKLLTKLLKLPSPKEDIDGSQVADIYYNDKDLERIVKYCEQDVTAVAQIILRFKRLPPLDKEHIIVKN